MTPATSCHFTVSSQLQTVHDVTIISYIQSKPEQAVTGIFSPCVQKNSVGRHVIINQSNLSHLYSAEFTFFMFASSPEPFSSAYEGLVPRLGDLAYSCQLFVRFCHSMTLARLDHRSILGHPYIYCRTV